MRTRLRRSVVFAAILASLFLEPQYACANAGVPMIFLTLPGMVIALLPVIVLEMLVLRRMLILSSGRAFRVSALANGVSTFFGTPLTWILLTALEMLTGGDRAYGIDTLLKKFLAVTWQAPWLIPYERELYWMVPVAAMWLLIPFFFMSSLLEYRVALNMLKDVGRVELKSAVFKANVLSYLFLGVVVLGWLIYSIVSRR